MSFAARSRAQAAADQNVVADELPGLDDAQETEVVGMDIGAIIFRQCEGRLELARQVGLAVNRFDRVVTGGRHERRGRGGKGFNLFAVEPDFPVR